MIRRQPTLIALNDSDVQTVRDLLEQVREERAVERRVQEQTLGASVPESNMASNAGTVPALASAPEGLTAQARQHARNERLGLR